MQEIKLGCACGDVRGVAYIASPASGNRVVCCCADCQSFAEYLGNQQAMMDEFGGTDIYQMPISKVVINQGQINIACLRLSEKGLYRWYAACCKTPIGNALGAGAPFIGLVHNFIVEKTTLDAVIGKSRGHINVKDASARVPDDLKGALLPIALRTLRKLAVWKLMGYNRPSAFFGAEGEPVVEPFVVKK